MLRHRIDQNILPLKFIKATKESFLDIYQQIFTWSDQDKDDSINGLSRDYVKDEFSFYEEERLIKIKMEQEIFLENQ